MTLMPPPEVANILLRSHLSNKKTKVQNGFIRGLICPECQKEGAYSSFERPFYIFCPHLNSCGARIKTSSVFPEILTNVEKQFPATKADPNRPALEYLKRRGVNKALQGLAFEYWPRTRKGEGGAVMFPLGNGVYAGRLFNPSSKAKSHAKGSYAGRHWQHPGRKLDPNQPVWVVEGVLDALSLIEAGYQAIALIGAGQDPERIDLSPFNDLIVAFDGDEAGRRYFFKWEKRLSVEASIKGRNLFYEFVTLEPGLDWNDLLLRCGSGEKLAEYIEKNRSRFRGNAKILMSRSPYIYACNFLKFKHVDPGFFEFEGQYHFATVKYSKKEDEPPEITVQRVSDFTCKALYFQIDKTIEDAPENTFGIEFKPKKGKPSNIILSGLDLASPDSVTKAFLRRCRGVWTGPKPAVNAFCEMITHSKIPEIRKINEVGHDAESNFYIFRDFGVSPSGKIISEKDGLIDVGGNNFVRLTQHETIKPDAGIDARRLYGLIDMAWPDTGAVALAWTVASWFAHDIREKIRFFPFLSLHGDPASGKTNLAINLNACQCIDGEGFSIRKQKNTHTGQLRTLSQFSDLFVGITETVEADCDQFLEMYNRNAVLRIMGQKTIGNETRKILFKGALLFVQNKEPFKEPQHKQRVISLKFKTDTLTEETMRAFNDLAAIPLPQKASFYQQVMVHRPLIESTWISEYEAAKKALSGVGDARIIENHSVVLAFHKVLCRILKITPHLEPFIKKIGALKQIECNRREGDFADYFFDLVSQLDENSESYDLCVDFDPEGRRLYLNLPGVEREIAKQGYTLRANIKDIIKHLGDHPAMIREDGEVNPRRHRFTTIRSAGKETKQLRAWVFDVDLTGV